MYTQEALMKDVKCVHLVEQCKEIPLHSRNNEPPVNALYWIIIVSKMHAHTTTENVEYEAILEYHAKLRGQAEKIKS